jgi:allophanate hydrolase
MAEAGLRRVLFALANPVRWPRTKNGANRVGETVEEIVAAHRSGAGRPEDTVARSFARIRAQDDPAIFISLAEETDALRQAAALDVADAGKLPLYGVPVAVKDNIDVAGLPTTAACPAFSYMPQRDATVVAKLRAAGAIVIGKTNLDQFATGLVGVRSPYGVPKNPFNPALIPGGSSSGSAVAVSSGIVPLALGTDTAGSGRVPAGLNNLVGLKPTLGLVSTSGVVPACRSLDCVSIFSLTADDAFTALTAIAGFDDADSYSRHFELGSPGTLPPATVVGVPRKEDRLFFGDTRSEAAFEQSIELARSIGVTIVELDFSHLLEAARLLYGGPWVAERTAAVGGFIAAHPGEIFPVTREIIASGDKPNAVDAFKAFYRMQDLRALARKTMAAVDFLMVPTTPAAYTVAELEAEPVRLNSNLGTYTNFVNLMDMSGLAVPAVFANDGTPFGVTFLARAGEDARLASICRVFHARSGLPLGARKSAQPRLRELAAHRPGQIEIAVIGAHLSGMALNHELTSLGGSFVAALKTAPDYRLFALGGEGPARPGMLRVSAGSGAQIEAELWSLSPQAFGQFVAGIPAPLSIGTLRFENGKTAKGFLVEAEAVRAAQDISSFGGWRKYVASQRKDA